MPLPAGGTTAAGSAAPARRAGRRGRGSSSTTGRTRGAPCYVRTMAKQRGVGRGGGFIQSKKRRTTCCVLSQAVSHDLEILSNGSIFHWCISPPLKYQEPIRMKRLHLKHNRKQHQAGPAPGDTNRYPNCRSLRCGALALATGSLMGVGFVSLWRNSGGGLGSGRNVW